MVPTPILILATGCTTLLDPSARDGASLRYAEGSLEADLIVRAANALSFETLDAEVGLDRRAADNLVYVRSGPDLVDGTDDDTPFETLAAVDAVPFVGPAALEAMLAYADALWGPEEVHGIDEGSEDALRILDLANRASHEVLADEVGLSWIVACRIVERRAGADEIDGTDDDTPFDRLAALALVDGVDADAFAALLEHALNEQTVPDCPPGYIVSSDGQTLFRDLRSALQGSPDGVVLDLCEGAFVADRIRPASVTLRGRGASATAIVPPEDAAAFIVEEDAHFTLIDATVSGGRSEASGSGAGYGVVDVYGQFSASRVVFADNEMRYSGAIRATGAVVDLVDVRFVDNAAWQHSGGAIDARSASQITATRTGFEGNSAALSGAAIYLTSNASAALIDSWVWANAGGNGAVYLTVGAGTLSAENVDFGWGDDDNTDGDVYLANTGLRYDYRAGATFSCTDSECR